MDARLRCARPMGVALQPWFAVAWAAVVFGMVATDSTDAQDNMAWMQRTQQADPRSPTLRELFDGMEYDPISRETLLFGGYRNGQYFGDTWAWRWNVTLGSMDWVQKQPCGDIPAARHGCGMAYNPLCETAVLFGGTGASIYNDTWEWSSESQVWTLRPAAPSPEARAFHAMLYDFDRRVVVLFGGSGPGWTAHNDTWEYDCATATWTNRTDPDPAFSPAERYHHRVVYDSARHVLVLFGGAIGSGGVEDDDTWEGVWSEATQTYRWSQVLPQPNPSPSPRSGFGMVYDTARQKTVLFGGYDWPDLESASDETWEWDGQTWALRSDLNPRPSARGWFGMAYDEDRQVTVLFGGAYPYANDTWECGHDNDGDGWIDLYDNCPDDHNPDQADCDGDGVGDVCDDDIDGDGVANAAPDVCPDTPGCDVMPDGRPRLDLNNDCNVDGLDMQLIVQELLAGCSTCN